MPEQPTTSDLVERARWFVEAANRRDWDAVMGVFAPDPVLESMGMATSFEGVAAIRGFFEDFIAAYEQYAAEPEEILDLGSGVTFSVIFRQGRAVGSTAHVQMRYGAVTTWAHGLIKRSTNYTDIDEGRAAAERLAQERG